MDVRITLKAAAAGPVAPITVAQTTTLVVLLLPDHHQHLHRYILEIFTKLFINSKSIAN